MSVKVDSFVLQDWPVSEMKLGSNWLKCVSCGGRLCLVAQVSLFLFQDCDLICFLLCHWLGFNQKYELWLCTILKDREVLLRKRTKNCGELLYVVYCLSSAV